MICKRMEFSIFKANRIVVLRTFHSRRPKSLADFKALDRRNAEHRPGKNRLHFIEHGLPESHRRFPNFQGQDRADGILRQFRFANARLHFCARFRIRAANRRSFYGFCRHLRRIHMGIHLAHGLHPAQNLRSAGGFQNLVRHGTRRNPSEGFPCRRTPAPPIIAKAVF